MWADCGVLPCAASAPRQRAERIANRSEIGELLVHVGQLAPHEIADVAAGQAASPFDRHDLLDLAQREPQPAGLGHKVQPGQCFLAVYPVASHCATRRG
jgi:hypothetical protein